MSTEIPVGSAKVDKKGPKPPKPPRRNWEMGAEFAAHVGIATLVFIIIGSGVVALAYFALWVEQLKFVDLTFVKALKGMEWVVFGLDVISFITYLLITTLSFVRELITGFIAG